MATATKVEEIRIIVTFSGKEIEYLRNLLRNPLSATESLPDEILRTSLFTILTEVIS